MGLALEYKLTFGSPIGLPLVYALYGLSIGCLRVIALAHGSPMGRLGVTHASLMGSQCWVINRPWVPHGSPIGPSWSAVGIP